MAFKEEMREKTNIWSISSLAWFYHTKFRIRWNPKQAAVTASLQMGKPPPNAATFSMRLTTRNA